jgi:uncharacterized protein (DUF2141 family)
MIIQKKGYRMKKVIFSIILLGSYVFAVDINIEVQNLKNTVGKVFIGLYNKSKNFTIVSKVYKGVDLYIGSHTLSYTFKEIPYGIYAISIFHDENSNKKLDKNFLGIPNEGYGFSNNAKVMLSIPSFNEAKFKISTHTVNLKIKMEY